MRLMLLFVFAAAPLYACCPVDKDSLADEVPNETLLNELAGLIPRYPDEYWQARLGLVSEGEEPPFEQSLLRAECLDQLNRQPEGLDILLALKTDGLTAEQAAALSEKRLQLAFDLWWQGGTDACPPDECLRIATESLGGPNKDLMAQIIRWAAAGETADPDRYLPDFFNLRYTTDKTSDHDTGELNSLGLSGASEFLLGQMRRHPAWENFDVLYALNLLYVVEGRQNLAYYARLRCWQMHETGERSSVKGAAEIADIKPLTILRQNRAGVLVAVKVVSDENQAAADEQFEARRAYVKQWMAARLIYARQHADDMSDPQLWANFEPLKVDFPPLRRESATATTTSQSEPSAVPESPSAEQAPADKPKGSRTITWITIAILATILALGALAKSRLKRADTLADGSLNEELT